jgi:hypothetical protein
MTGRRRWGAVSGMAALGVLAAAMVGPLPVASAQDETTKVDTRFAYLCPFPSGEQRVEVRLSAEFPVSATVEQPVRPSGLAIELTVPQAALAELTARGAASVTAVARVDVSIAQGSAGAETNWSGTETDPVAVPAEGDLVLPLDPARLVHAVLGKPGKTVFSAGGLSLALTGYLPDGEVTDPPSLELPCSLDPSQDPTIATVQVSEVDNPVTSEPPPGAVRVEEQPPAGVLEDAPPPEPGMPDKDCAPIEPPESPEPVTFRYCANIVAYTSLAKLDASVFQPSSLVNIGPTGFLLNPFLPDSDKCVPEGGEETILCQKANFIPNLDGEPNLRPAADQWLLPFGFVPTKATMQLTQVGVSTIDIAVHAAIEPQFSHVIAIARYDARVYDAFVAGAKLDLGPNCRTVRPIEVRLNGTPGFLPGQYLLDEGGLLSGEAEIPPFTGCGKVEDVSPLLTGLISGSDNLVRLTQGRVCPMTEVPDLFRCPPAVPVPQL